jgi:hypothetical protein
MLRLMAGALCLGVLGASPLPSHPRTSTLFDDLDGIGPRFGLTGTAQTLELSDPVSGSPVEDEAGEPGPSPFLAGLMSAAVPGSGQLIQGQRRGWLYLGVEAAIWFSFFALRSAGDQAEEDFQEFGDEHWDWIRYAGEDGESPSIDCGEGLGPDDFATERDNLLDLLENAKDDFYEEIDLQDVYACGWDDQANRIAYQGMRDDADNLYRSSRWVGSAAILNRIVSAIDAARSAARRRQSAVTSLDWRVSPRGDGSLAVRLSLRRSF